MPLVPVPPPLIPLIAFPKGVFFLIFVFESLPPRHHHVEMVVKLRPPVGPTCCRKCNYVSPCVARGAKAPNKTSPPARFANTTSVTKNGLAGRTWEHIKVSEGRGWRGENMRRYTCKQSGESMRGRTLPSALASLLSLWHYASQEFPWISTLDSKRPLSTS